MLAVEPLERGAETGERRIRGPGRARERVRKRGHALEIGLRLLYALPEGLVRTGLRGGCEEGRDAVFLPHPGGLQGDGRRRPPLVLTPRRVRSAERGTRHGGDDHPPPFGLRQEGEAAGRAPRGVHFAQVAHGDGGGVARDDLVRALPRPRPARGSRRRRPAARPCRTPRRRRPPRTGGTAPPRLPALRQRRGGRESAWTGSRQRFARRIAVRSSALAPRASRGDSRPARRSG
jgi:hypothetical protein